MMQISANRPVNPLLTGIGFKSHAFRPLRASFGALKPRRGVSVSASSSVVGEKEGRSDSKKEKLRVVVKPIERPRLVLKFIWMEKNIGMAIDQVIPGGQGTIPLSPYYFWPRKDAWEELRTMLESRQWISQKQKVILLNQATDIINFWQQHTD